MTNINDTIEFIAGTYRAIANKTVQCTAYTNIYEMREYLLGFGLWCAWIVDCEQRNAETIQTKYVMPFGRTVVAVSVLSASTILVTI